jgi:GAF domain-containing protein
MGDIDMAASNVADDPGDHSSLSVIRHLQGWAIEASKSDLSSFFQSLVAVLAKVFEAQLVTIWDNNDYGDCLVLLASQPERRSVLASHTVPAETSLTGLAVQRKKFIYHPSLLNSTEGKYFANPDIVRELHLSSMISVPVFRPTSMQSVSLVINFCFDSSHQARSLVSNNDAERLLSRLGADLQYHIYKRDEQINKTVQSFAAASKGVASLFDSISVSLQNMANCKRTALFSWDKFEGRPKLERSADMSRRGDAKNGTESGLEAFDEEHRSMIVSACIEKGEPVVVRSRHGSVEGRTPSQGIVTVSHMAIPILSSASEVLGVITCSDPIRNGGLAPSFSSLDLRALETFSHAVAPPIERFLSLREESSVMKMVNAVSQAMIQARDLDDSLQRAIETLIEVLHSEVGSVYLRDGESDVFRMRAAKGSNEKLIRKATYRVGEGITGAVAAGQVLSFKSLAEMRKHPNYLGRYDSEIWGADPDHESETFLGVPIVLLGRVIGLWKISNIFPTDNHPDPYYTDEDIQAAQILSSLAAYAIQNHQLEDKRLEQFKTLAKTVQIQESSDVDEAILFVMIALEEAGFQGALLSLYNKQTRKITGEQSSGKTWKGLRGHTSNIDDEEIRAVVLRNNLEEFIPDSAVDPRCLIAGGNQLRFRSQYVLPLRINEELIGTLQVDLGDKRELQDDERLVLRAFANHLSIAISRMRSIEETLELTNQIMSSSRFIVAESLSGMAVHSLHHKLTDLTVQLKKELDRQEIRQNSFLLKTLSQWNTNLRDLEMELKKILNFVRAPASDTLSSFDLHPEVKICIGTWFNYMRNQKCRVQHRLEATKSRCSIPVEGFREILAVLFVNAVQAHAKQIDLKTYNENDVNTVTGNIIQSAFCLVCSDDGDGLVATQTEEIFEATYTTKKEHLGTGLGLFVARRLARSSAGDLEVVSNSRQSKGAAFRLMLPLTEDQRDAESA